MVCAELVLCFCCFQYAIGFSLVRTKRQNELHKAENDPINTSNNCYCVQHYQCINGSMNTFGEEMLDFRRGHDNDDCEEGDFTNEYVCCKLRPKEDNTKTSTSKVCGEALINIYSRINNDEDDDKPRNGEFPWLVTIFQKERFGNRWLFYGTGSLIHPRVILTANFNVVSAKANGLKVIANGETELGEIGRNPNQERNIKEIVKHQKYDSGRRHNDIALLILEEPYDVTNTPYLNTLCLSPNISYENKSCIVAGWSKPSWDEDPDKELRKVEVPTHQHSKCEQMLNDARKSRKLSLHESSMCAGGEPNRDVSEGDEGSPLACYKENTKSMYQVGIVSWGIGSGQKDVPSVYSNVVFLYDWIASELKARAIYLSE